MLDKIRQEILQEIDALAEDLYSISKQLYDNPEIAFEEHQSCDILCRYLENHDFEVERGVGGLDTAFYAKLPGSEASPTLAFLAEYDALPKIGHGCGHNLIAAASIGAGVALSRYGNSFDGNVLIIGTPAEEGGGGKITLLNAGVFEKVDAALMFHPGDQNLVGSQSLGRIKVRIEFFGKTAHAAGSPHEGLNALDAMIAFFCNIGLLRQQLRGEAKVHGVITHGGEAPNIIPDYTSALFYVRALEPDYLDDVYGKVCRCAEGAALASSTELKISPAPLRYESQKRNQTLEQLCRTKMELLDLPIEEADPSKMASTDLGNLSRALPTIHPYLAIVDKGIASHSTTMADATLTPRGQKAMLDAAKMLALTAYDYLSSPDIQTAVAKEFKCNSFGG